MPTVVSETKFAERQAHQVLPDKNARRCHLVPISLHSVTNRFRTSALLASCSTMFVTNEMWHCCEFTGWFSTYEFVEIG